jgi:mannose-1-phosphate guanylyltransferase/phosphomannomutase
MQHEQLTCPTAAKGMLMRVMLERFGSQKVSTLDGVKIFSDEGWTLILPDPTYPKVHVYTNGSSAEFCQSQMAHYKDYVLQLIAGHHS